MCRQFAGFTPFLSEERVTFRFVSITYEYAFNSLGPSSPTVQRALANAVILSIDTLMGKL